MQRLESITSDEMVLAFLKAEVDSGLFGRQIVAWLERHGWDRGLIDKRRLRRRDREPPAPAASR